MRGGDPAESDEKHIEFEIVPSAAATNRHCLQDATARVRIDSKGPVEHMDVLGISRTWRGR